MSALVQHSQCLQQPHGLCLSSRCINTGPQPSAEACAAACDASPGCSAITWAGPNNNCCHYDCYFRFDGEYEPTSCGTCDQTTANKTAGWVPPVIPFFGSPSCATNGSACPPPAWEPEWNLTRSTVVQPWCTDTFKPVHPWGLISLAWDCSTDGEEEAATRVNCSELKSSGIATRCFM